MFSCISTYTRIVLTYWTTKKISSFSTKSFSLTYLLILKCKPHNVITILAISDLGLVNLDLLDLISRLKTISVITLSRFSRRRKFKINIARQSFKCKLLNNDLTIGVSCIMEKFNNIQKLNILWNCILQFLILSILLVGAIARPQNDDDAEGPFDVSFWF